MDKCKSCKFGIWLNADQVYFCLTNESKVYRPEVCVTWEPHNNGWHPFRQERNQETGLWEFVDPPVDGQQILVTIRSQNGVLQDFVIEDIWYEDGYDHLESGYMPCAEAIAWKEWPEPYKGGPDE